MEGSAVVFRKLATLCVVSVVLRNLALGQDDAVLRVR